jgi:hypothetical protein
LGQRAPFGQHNLHSRQNRLRLFGRPNLYHRHALGLLLNCRLHLDQGAIQMSIIQASGNVQRIVQLRLQTSGNRFERRRPVGIECLNFSHAAVGEL